jgi:tetratricopeptide (TPR) repeat protein
VTRRLERLLPLAGAVRPELRAAALRVRGGALHVGGDFETCDASYEESLALYRRQGSDRGVASLLQRLANSAFQRGELDVSRSRLEESQELAVGRFPYIEIANVSVLGRIALAAGEVDEGVDLLRRAADMADEQAWHWWRSGCLATLSLVAVDRGDLEGAVADSREALGLIREDESRTGALLPLTVLARVDLARGDARRAGLIWGALEAEFRRSLAPAWRLRYEDRAGPLRDARDPAFLSRVEEGADLDIWDAVAIALGEDEPQTVP